MSTQEALAALGAASPFLLLAGGWLINRRVTRATAERTAAEARLAAANTDKASIDVQAVILANTKNLLAEARVVQTEKDAIAQERISVSQERISVLTDRTNRLEARFEALRTALATHGVWDAAALIDLRSQKPDYPDPPPFPPANHPDER